MSKQTIPSLVRQAAKTETDFVNVVEALVSEEDNPRLGEFFDKMNIPRSVAGDNFFVPVYDFTLAPLNTTNLIEEQAVSDGMQKFLDRHERKIRWHAGHPSEEGVANVLLLVRCGISVTNLRLARLHKLMGEQDELDPYEWAVAREVMNRSYLTFRNFLEGMAGPWIDALNSVLTREEVATCLGTFYELIDLELRLLEEYRTKLEDRRRELTVLPEGFPPVKPPNYFGGDLLGRGPWTQFWKNIDARAHYFRESVG